jgi:hypothetical protein
MDSSRRELSHTGDKRDTHTGRGAAAKDPGQRSHAPGKGDATAAAKGGASAAPTTSAPPSTSRARDAQRDDGRGRDARRNGSDSGRG